MEFAGILAMPLPAAIRRPVASMVGGLVLLLIALALFAAIDVPLQLRLHASRLKMSHQEFKQEHKELEGNSEIKGKVRARMREMTKRRMMAAVPKADLVVMNPTHYAVALKYDDKTMARRASSPRAPTCWRCGFAMSPRKPGAGAGGAGAGAGALRARRARSRDPGATLRCGRAGAGLCLSAAGGDGGQGADAAGRCPCSTCRPSSIRTRPDDHGSLRMNELMQQLQTRLGPTRRPFAP